MEFSKMIAINNDSENVKKLYHFQYWNLTRKYNSYYSHTALILSRSVEEAYDELCKIFDIISKKDNYDLEFHIPNFSIFNEKCKLVSNIGFKNDETEVLFYQLTDELDVIWESTVDYKSIKFANTIY